MATVGDLIAGSLRLIGALSSSEVPAGQEQHDAFNALSDMLDRWSTNGLVVFDKIIEPFTLVAGQQSYTIGTGGDFDTVRPQKILNAGIQFAGISPATELPVNIINLDQWSEIIVKDIQSTLPIALYLEDSFPLAVINLWPVPSAANILNLYSWKPLTPFASASTVISLPPGFAEALRYNLAVRLAPEYGKTPREDIVQIAMDSLADLKRMNTKPVYLEIDSDLMGRKQYFNWRSGV